MYRCTCREEASVNYVVVPKLLHSNHILRLGHEHLQLLGYPQEFLLVMESKSHLHKKDVQNDPTVSLFDTCTCNCESIALATEANT